MQIKHRRNKTSKFIPNLHKILSEPHSGACWRKDEKSFIIYDISELITNSLPKHFRHTNISSFIRQLNLYGFKKIVGQDVPENTYFHEKFKKDYIIELKPIRSFYNQQKFGKGKKPKKTRNESINHETKQQNQEPECLLGTGPFTTPSVGISQKQKNAILEKEVQRLKAVQQEHIKLLDFLSKTQGWPNPFGICIPQAQENLFGLNWYAKAPTESYAFPQETNLAGFEGQATSNGEGIPIYQQPAYCFPFLGIQ